MQLTSIILAAGYSSRMGADKALLKVDGKTVLENIIDKLIPVSENISIIRAKESENIPDYIAYQRIRLIYNPFPERGMFYSLKLFAMNNPPGKYFLIHLIDQPFIKYSTYRKLANSIDSQHQVFIPNIESEKRSGHPIIITKTVMNMIKKAPYDSNLKLVIKSLPADAVVRIPVDDMNILDNINTPAQFKEKITAKG